MLDMKKLKKAFKQGFEKEAQSDEKPSATIVKGNPDHVKDNEKAKEYYDEIANYLREKGFSVETDPGKRKTVPSEEDDLWIGHSRGVERLQYAPDDIKTLAFGAPEEDAYTHPKDRKLMLEEGREYEPVDEHYQFIDEQMQAIDKAVQEIK